LPDGKKYRSAFPTADSNLELSVLFRTIPVAVLVEE
jgi:hypothetical protein